MTAIQDVLPIDPVENDYERRLREQIDQYDNNVVIHDLPRIFHEWSRLFVAPAFKAVFDSLASADVYAAGFLDCASIIGGHPRFLSLGCGDGTMEIDIAQRLRGLGLTQFEFVCIDLSPILLARFAQSIPAELKDCFVLRDGDINRQALDQRFHAIMANHSLHHMVALEEIFAASFDALHDRGSFLTNDMIGRNGHQRWPETRLFLDFFWPLLTERQRFNLQLQRHEWQFLEHDCSTSGFEGIRSQDILPLIIAAGFKAHSFFGFGGFIDPFIDRSFGHGLSVDNPDDVFLVRRLGLMNEILLDAGIIKPTMMMARFVKYDTQEVAYRGRTLAAAVRPAAEVPSWLAGALVDLEAVEDDPYFVFKETADAKVERLTRESANLVAAVSALKSPLRMQPTDVSQSIERVSNRTRRFGADAARQSGIVDALVQLEAYAAEEARSVAKIHALEALAAERAELVARIHVLEAESAERAGLVARVHAQAAEKADLVDEIQALEAQAAGQAELISRIHASTSWRSTASLRWLARTVRGR